MSILTLESSVIPNWNEFVSYYGRPALNSGPKRTKGDIIVVSGTKIIGLCDNCRSEFSFKYFPDKISQGIIDNTLCAKCKIKSTKRKNHGDPNYNNREKAIQTNNARYGMNGPPRKGINKGKEFSSTHKRNISIAAKRRLSDPENHPWYGKKHTEESNMKNRLSQYAYLKANGLRNTSSNSFECGEFYSQKNNKIVNYRSSYEKGFLFLLENCINIINYAVEEINIPYVDIDGKNRLYYPDFTIEVDDGNKYIIEIKSKNFMNDATVLQKKKFAEKYAEKNDYSGYYLITIGDFHSLLFTIVDSISFTQTYYKWITNTLERIA